MYEMRVIRPAALAMAVLSSTLGVQADGVSAVCFPELLLYASLVK